MSRLGVHLTDWVIVQEREALLSMLSSIHYSTCGRGKAVTPVLALGRLIPLYLPNGWLRSSQRASGAMGYVSVILLFKPPT